MSRPPKRAPFPERDAILKFIRESEGRASKREIARAFHLDAAQKTELRALLKELENEGTLERRRGRRYAAPGQLPEVAVLAITGVDAEGDLTAEPLSWNGEGPPPTLRMAPERGTGPALGRGDKVLARLSPTADGYLARTIRRLPRGPAQAIGIYREQGGRGRILSIDKRDKYEIEVAREDSGGAVPGELVRVEPLPARRLGPRRGRVVERLGSPEDARSASLVSLIEHDIPIAFPKAALLEAEAARAAPLSGREDLRDVPLVTIDGADARDFDDAVYAEPDPDPANAGGFRLIVAIADVAWYVRPGSALDDAAYERGNSVYFPDRVVPMLPEALSNGWCSLKPREDRSCLAAHMRIDARGKMLGHRFSRAMMRSTARLTYEQVQAAADGQPDDVTGPLLDRVIRPLYAAYRALAAARAERGVLEIDVPERRVILGPDGRVVRVETRARYDSHRLVEDFMISANVAAAETLERLRQPSMYRIHDEPTREKLEVLRDFLDTIGLKLVRGQVTRPEHFNIVLGKARGTPHVEMIHEAVLRTQAQAEYAPDNIGHFGLALIRYCHFTSPIRRYSDLLVHRALIRGLKLGAGGLEDDHRDFKRMGEHLSATERRAAEAERDAIDRFAAAFLADRVGAWFPGRIRAVTRFGLFVGLDEIGVDGLVPIGSLGSDYFRHDERRHVLKGQRTGKEFRIGQRVEALLVEANPVTGGILLQLTNGDGAAGRPTHGRGRQPGRGGRGPRRKG